ncbi:protein Niban 2 [Oenanthe melanoleuca]|uniref:protein Niban 2 n=1 Tax=Oenanthe melanoleuca TaxID=2939378 RepID=UPI0024C1AA26|nr:protein Niban 2 [Oenanthe melanoleuca]
MGDVVSTHLDEGRRQHIAERTGKVLGEFCRCYKEQFGVALFNSVRYEIEGAGGPQAQLLHRKVPLEDHVIYSGNIFQYIEENKKWRNRFCVVPHNYGLVLYENKLAYERELPPRVLVNSAGYKVLTSVEQYLELVNSSLPGVTPKSGHSPIVKCPTDFPLLLWHPYARHYYFCVMTGKEQEKWRAVFQDCVRHCNNGISEDSKVEAPAFTDAIRMYRQSKEQYGTWDMLCGNETQVLSNLVMEELLPELRSTIGPRLKGKAPERQRTWIQVSDAVYRMVYELAKAQYDAAVARCEQERPQLESTIRTDMDQIITSKEHLASKIRAFVLPKAEVCVRNHVQPYIPSILEALMAPTSQGFAEVRELFFKEVTDLNMNVVNEGGLEKLVEYMEKLSHLAFHPVKMQSCYEKMDQLKLEGLQQRFDVSSTSVFKQRAQIHMRQQMDDAVYTFETLLHQELGKLQGKDELCKSIQRILERVLKKFDYDSSTVRKKFFREALLQITIPFLLKKLAPTCKGELAKFQELIFEDFASFILVENTYEEVVLQSVMKDIMQAVKEAAVQRKHNLYRDSMVMHNSDPNLHLLGEGLPIDWGEESGGQPEAERRRRARQVVSVIQDDEGALPFGAEALLQPGSPQARGAPPGVPPSPGDAVREIREALAQQSPGAGAERLMNGSDGSGASEEGALLAGAARGEGTQQGPARDGDGVHRVAPPAPAAEIPAGTGGEHGTPALSPVPGAEIPSGTGEERVTPALSPVPGAEIPSGTVRGEHVTPALSPVPAAEIPSGTGEECVTPALSPVQGAEIPSGTGEECVTPALSPVPGAEIPTETGGEHVTPALSSVQGAEIPSGTGGEHVTPALSSVQGAEIPSGTGGERVTPALSPVPGAKVPSGAGTRRAAPAPPVPGAEVSSGTGGQRSGPASPVPRAGVPAEAEVPHATPRSSVPASPMSGADVPSGAEVPHATPRSPGPASPVPRAGVPAEAEVPRVTPRSSVPASPVPGAEPQPAPSVPHAAAAAAGVAAEAEVSLVTAAPPGAQSPSPACHQRGDRGTGERGERSPPQGRASTQSGEGLQTEF